MIVTTRIIRLAVAQTDLSYSARRLPTPVATLLYNDEPTAPLVDGDSKCSSPQRYLMRGTSK